jgi:hypothetical protein
VSPSPEQGHDEHDEGYTGPAVLTVDGRDVPVHVRLDARHEPQDGRLHWFGRMSLGDGSAEPALLAALTGGGALELRTGGGRAAARVGDQDPWGRYRVTGVGAPPYAVDEPALDED